MVTTKARSKKALAEDVWRLMMTYTTSSFQTEERLGELRKLGLTPGHFKALWMLDPEEPRSMGALADALACDASMVTWLVDRMEERGLVERRTLPSDRRVKTLILTPLGIKTRRDLAQVMARPPEGIKSMDEGSLEALYDALQKLPPVEPSWWLGNVLPVERAGR